ncbi:lipase family protein [Nocardia sp. CDC159]|uniref:Lipase family protein n=1 Tax=Nocardia pulmonis TaxID=2951408 RepID=A0A9X2ECZ2_9NOCA|nr:MULTISPECIES: lipase family protein [Nocardia]MCM6778559.1 lipase family protein [Nocardia pulmonis]MCM6791448.1 lipase family protein [Nocardia sp. CDC159]
MAVAIAATWSTVLAGAGRAEPTPLPVQPVLPPGVPPAQPQFDPAFYDPPADVIAAKQAGEIIAAREVHLGFEAVLPINVDAWQLSFRSTDHLDRPIAAVTTVMKPRGGDGGQPWNLLSYQFATDTSGPRYCSPSYVLQLGAIPPPLIGSLLVGTEFLLPITAAGAGWVVNMPDFDGPNMAFGAGPLNGRITLDSIRAAENFVPLGLSGVATKVALAGYSGGAIPSGHAAELHPSYAPELDIVGVVEGGIPADLRAMVKLANGNLASGLLLSGILGARREYAELAAYLDQHMSPALKTLDSVKSGLCYLYSLPVLPFLPYEQMFDIADPFHGPVPDRVFDELRMGHAVPRAPMFMFNANPDWVVPIDSVNRLVDYYCSDPEARVVYTRDHFSEHITAEYVAVAQELVWLKDRFDGVPMTAGCEIRDEGSMLLDPASWPAWLQSAGTLLAAATQQPIGQR